MDKLSLIISKIRRNHWYRTYMRPIYLFVYGNRKLKNRNRIFLQYSQELLTNFHQAMNEVGIPYWLEFGTLLGAVREHSFISHDFDLDVGLFKEDYSDIIREVLKKYGFKRIRCITALDFIDAYEETYLYKGVTIDLFFFSREKNCDGVYCYDFVPVYSDIKRTKKGDNAIRRIHFPRIDLIEYSFIGINTFVPENYEEHLCMHYGKDYMIPNPHWKDSDAQHTDIFYGREIRIELFDKSK